MKGGAPLEAVISKNISHPGIVQVFDYTVHPGQPVWMLTELCDLGTLQVSLSPDHSSVFSSSKLQAGCADPSLATCRTPATRAGSKTTCPPWWARPCR